MDERSTPQSDQHAAPAGAVPLLLSVEQTCRVLNLSRSTVNELVATGKLASGKVGKRRLIHRDSVAEFAAAIVWRAT